MQKKTDSYLNILKDIIFKIIYPIRFYLYLFTFISFLFALETSLKPYLFKLFINAATIKEQDLLFSKLSQIAIYITLIQFLIHLCKRISDWSYIYIELHFKGKVLKDTLGYILNQDYKFFKNRLTGETNFKISDFTQALQNFIIVGIQLNANILAMMFSFSFLYYINPLFGFAILIWGILIVVISVLTFERSCTPVTNLSKIQSLIHGNIIDILLNIVNLILFNTESYELKRLQKLQEKQTTIIKKYRFEKIKIYSIQGVLFVIYQAVSLCFLISLYIKKIITIGDFAFILAANLAMLDRLWSFSDQISLCIDSWHLIKKVIETFDIPSKIKKSDEPSSILNIKGGNITFDKVCFSYEQFSKKYFFENQSISIKGGQKVGLIGPSGGGKTTFLNLITRLYDVQDGKIMIDSQNIKDVTKFSLRNAIAIVSQESFLFNRSLEDNIRYGKLEAIEKEIIQAAKKACIHNFIMTLSEGYKTIVEERGVTLSGGQRQRILIARAILKNSPIIILDEPTSHLDYITEENVQKSLFQFMEGKTVLVAAHRLRTLSFMDRIIIFKEGKIIQDGTPQELLSDKNLCKNFLGENS